MGLKNIPGHTMGRIARHTSTGRVPRLIARTGESSDWHALRSEVDLEWTRGRSILPGYTALCCAKYTEKQDFQTPHVSACNKSTSQVVPVSVVRLLTSRLLNGDVTYFPPGDF
jgi:hypothetical protein